MITAYLQGFEIFTCISTSQVNTACGRLGSAGRARVRSRPPARLPAGGADIGQARTARWPQAGGARGFPAAAERSLFGVGAGQRRWRRRRRREEVDLEGEEELRRRAAFRSASPRRIAPEISRARGRCAVAGGRCGGCARNARSKVRAARGGARRRGGAGTHVVVAEAACGNARAEARDQRRTWQSRDAAAGGPSTVLTIVRRRRRGSSERSEERGYRATE